MAVEKEEDLKVRKLRGLINVASGVVGNMAAAGAVGRAESEIFAEKIKKREGTALKKVDEEYAEVAGKLKLKLGAKNKATKINTED